LSVWGLIGGHLSWPGFGLEGFGLGDLVSMRGVDFCVVAGSSPGVCLNVYNYASLRMFARESLEVVFGRCFGGCGLVGVFDRRVSVYIHRSIPLNFGVLGGPFPFAWVPSPESLVELVGVVQPGCGPEKY
jgi:hypothetical protein